MRQLAEIDANPIDGICVYPSDDLSELRFDLDGPEGTPFSEGRFHVALLFDESYPEVPPKGFFRTKIFHPNVSDRGDICVNALKKDWSAQLGLRHVLLVIRCLLVEPNPESALNEEAGRLLLEDYADYERKARMLTGVHAKRGHGVPRITHEIDQTQPTGNEASAENPQGLPATRASSGGEAGPLRSLGRNAYGTGANAAGKKGGDAAEDAGASVNASVDKAKKKTADKKKNALKRI